MAEQRPARSPADSIAPGQSKTFTFNITAPDRPPISPAPKHCDWQMVQAARTFGAICANLVDLYSFADVTPDLTYWKHVEAIYAAGLTAGCGTDSQGRNSTAPRPTPPAP